MTERCVISEQAGPLFNLSMLELERCNVISFHVPLNEFERKTPGLSHRFDRWPPDVQRIMVKNIEQWHADNPTRVLRLTSAALHQGVCVVILHHAPKA